jgi:parvulin-like peptidyl-prolyl isomerase
VNVRHCALAVLAASVVASGCATFEHNDAAAVVNGVEISNDRLLAVIDDGSDLSPTASSALNALIEAQLRSDYLARRGVGITDIDRSAAAAQLQASPNWDGYGDELKAALIDVTVAESKLREQFTSEDVARRAYQAGVRSGIACVSHLLVATEDEAVAALERINSGEDFAAVAADVSTDGGSSANGGAYPCAPTDQFQTTYVAEYVNAALQAQVGVPTQPVQSQFGFHVLLVRPFESDAEQIVTTLGLDQAGLQVASAEILADATVTIDPRYGRWDADNGSVVPMDV